jgi:hypothetical protein
MQYDASRRFPSFLHLCQCHWRPNDNDLRSVDFLQFVPVTDVSGEGLASVIVNSLTEFGLNLAYLRGQGYDGEGAMSGKLNGVQARIRRMYPLAVYVHCASHSRNLTVVIWLFLMLAQLLPSETVWER